MAKAENPKKPIRIQKKLERIASKVTKKGSYEKFQKNIMKSKSAKAEFDSRKVKALPTFFRKC